MSAHASDFLFLFQQISFFRSKENDDKHRDAKHKNIEAKCKLKVYSRTFIKWQTKGKPIFMKSTIVLK